MSGKSCNCRQLSLIPGRAAWLRESTTRKKPRVKHKDESALTCSGANDPSVSC